MSNLFGLGSTRPDTFTDIPSPPASEMFGERRPTMLGYLPALSVQALLSKATSEKERQEILKRASVVAIPLPLRSSQYLATMQELRAKEVVELLRTNGVNATVRTQTITIYFVDVPLAQQRKAGDILKTGKPKSTSSRRQSMGQVAGKIFSDILTSTNDTEAARIAEILRGRGVEAQSVKLMVQPARFAVRVPIDARGLALQIVAQVRGISVEAPK